MRRAGDKWLRLIGAAALLISLLATAADEIAVRFGSDGGALERRVIEWFFGELTLQTYTFTDRLRYGAPSSEQGMRDLQKATSTSAPCSTASTISPSTLMP